MSSACLVIFVNLLRLNYFRCIKFCERLSSDLWFEADVSFNLLPCKFTEKKSKPLFSTEENLSLNRVFTLKDIVKNNI